MSNWLTFSAELIGVSKPEPLAVLFTQILFRELALKQCLLLWPASDGRLLLAETSEGLYSWDVTDFEHPFSHVLQSGKAKQLMPEELGFWQSNTAFNALFPAIGVSESISLQPLSMSDHSVQSILVMHGEHQILKKLFVEPEFIRFVEGFTRQWSLLTDMFRKEHNQQVLRDSLADYQQDINQRTLAEGLSLRLIGNSGVMQRLRQQIASAACSPLSVMIQGETGTGKELVAEAVHQLSSRKNAAFVAINCAAIPEALLESELFGYCKGAFSGADRDKCGLIEQANGGTLFLDEIGDMPLALQAKLLRVLESHSFRPVGGKEELSSDFRLISATHVNLLEQVQQKTFRQDLYYRLFQYPLVLPALKNRLDDIEQLSSHFIQSFNQLHGTQIRGVHFEALDYLKQHDFPGNVRELKHLIEFACAQTANGTQIDVNCLGQRMSASKEISTKITDNSMSVSQFMSENTIICDLKKALSDFEEKVIRERLTYFSGDRAKTAESLGIPKRTLAYKCQKLEL